MKLQSIIQGVAVAGLCFGVPGYSFAQDSSSGSAQSETTRPGMQMHEMGSAMHSQITAEVPTDANRASKIIGMDVMNQSNQKLGTVRDLVVDPKSQRIAYAWVEKADESGNTGKYLAVPANFFTHTTDQKNLVLNTEKSRFDSARGYAKNQLPNMAMSGSQLAFWQSIIEPAGAQQPGTQQQWQRGTEQQQEQQPQQPNR